MTDPAELDNLAPGSPSASEPDPPHIAAPNQDRERLLDTESFPDEPSSRRSSSNNGASEGSTSFNTSMHGPRGTLSYLNGLALVVSLQIGSGIFSAPSEVSKHVSSAVSGVCIWLFAGLLVWTGAASFIELGRAIPRNGGVQEYLRRCYGDFYGFLFSWIWITIAKPCSMAIIGTIFADYFTGALLPDLWSSIWINKFIAIIALWLITGLNCLGQHTGAHVANGFLVLKLFGLFSIVAIGLVMGVVGKSLGNDQANQSNWSNNRHAPPRSSLQVSDTSLWQMIGQYVTALFSALFCYGGWEAVGFVAGEMKNPSRDLPRVINSAMAIVLLGFVLMNVSLYIVLPMDAIRYPKTVAVTFGVHVFGTAGGLVYSLIVAISCLGALNAIVFTTGRLCVAASRRNYFPKFLGEPGCSTKEEEQAYYRKSFRNWPSWVVSSILSIARWTQHARWGKQVPVYAMVLSSLIASFYILIGTFGSLLTFKGISEYFFFFLAVLGVFIIRRSSDPSESVPRTCTFNPIVFCTVSGFLVLREVITSPMQGLAFLFFTGLGFIARHFLGVGSSVGTEPVNLETN